MSSTKFLDELDSIARRQLSDAEASALIEELRTHLELSAAARVELGTLPEEAEQQAVQSFGDPRMIVKKLYDQKHKWVDKKFAYLLMGIYVLSAGMLAYGEHVNSGTPQFPNVWLTTIWFLGIGAVIWSSARLRNPIADLRDLVDSCHAHLRVGPIHYRCGGRPGIHGE